MSRHKNTDSSITPRDVIHFHWQRAMKQKCTAIPGALLAASSLVVERYIAPIMIAALLSQLQAGTITLSSSLWVIIPYAVLILGTEVIGYRLALFLMWTTQIKGAKTIYEDAYQHLTKNSLDFFANSFTGSLVSQVTKLAAAYMSFWNMFMYQFTFIATSLIATLVGIGLISWLYAVILFLFTVVFTVTVYYGNRFMRPRFSARSKQYSKISAKLSDAISNILTVKIEGNEAREVALFQRTSAELLRKESHVRNGFIRVSTAYSFITASMRIAALMAAVILVQQHAIQAGVVYLCLVYTFNLLEEIWNINTMMRDYYQIVADSEEMLGIMRTESTLVDRNTAKLTVPHGQLSIHNISYMYEDNRPLFSDLSLTIPAGQKIGLVGVSGSGKTTLTKLLMRFMDVGDGEISIDGTPITAVSQRSLRQHIAYVPQEPLLFHRSLSENISYGKPRASKAMIIEAAKKARAFDFIDTLPKGFATLVGERGVKLSGGQRQRVAIARAILKDAPIIILDEATSALDSDSERLIQSALDELWQDKTAIVVAHRLSTIAKLDRIIVLDKGRIVEDGTHVELLKQNGTYAKLWQYQSGGFIED
jgi:ATP-binding cassette subfamily B protein